MTRQESYIAELSQLLFYMTAWDKAEVLKGITAMINHPETGVQTMEELGTPMKLAVTLHRQYTPTPEPTAEELAAKAAAEEVAEAAEEPAEEPVAEAAEEIAEETEAEEDTAEAAVTEEAPVAEEAPAEEISVEEEPEVSEAVEETEETEAAEEAPAAETVEEEAAEEADEAPAEEAAEELLEEPAEEVHEEAAEEEPQEEEPVVSLKYEERVGHEKIFAEIFNAATEAQSAPVIEPEAEKEVRRKARYWFLIPYIALAVVVGVPATLIFALANVAVFAVSMVSLAAVVYLVLFQLLPVAVLSSKLIILGLTLLMAVVTILLWTMTGWFLRTATIGFPRFLIEIARKYGYREVEVR